MTPTRFDRHFARPGTRLQLRRLQILRRQSLSVETALPPQPVSSSHARSRSGRDCRWRPVRSCPQLPLPSIRGPSGDTIASPTSLRSPSTPLTLSSPSSYRLYLVHTLHESSGSRPRSSPAHWRAPTYPPASPAPQGGALQGRSILRTLPHQSPRPALFFRIST